MGDFEAGRVSDVLYDRRLRRVVGLSVDEHGVRSSFLPWASARVGRDAVATWAPFALLATGELEAYLGECSSLTGELRTSGPAGLSLTDVLVQPDGEVVSLALDTEAEVEADADRTLIPAGAAV